MSRVPRRDFFGLSLAGLTSLEAAALAADPVKAPTKPVAKIAKAETKVVIDPATVKPLDTLFLTWQRDPTTTVTVQWVDVDRSGDLGKVEVAEVAEPGMGQSFAISKKEYHPLCDLKVYRAEATGLKPGTEYQFRIDKTDNTHRFRTMPAKATDTFQFISGGDCGANDHAIANNILAAKQNPMFALIGGDIAYDNGHDIKTNLAFTRNYSKHMVDGQGRLIPMVVCMGNHEVKGGYLGQRSDAPLFFAFHDGLFAERSFATLDFGDYMSLVLLDSGHCAAIDGEQTSWLGQQLAARSELAHLIAVNHVPAYPSFRPITGSMGKTGTGELNRTHWSPLFEKHLVDFVLEHHDHTYKRTHALLDGHVNKNGVVYLGDGSWGRLRPPKAAEARPYLARVSESYHLTLHRIEGDRRFHLAIEEGGRIVDIATTEKRTRKAGKS